MATFGRFSGRGGRGTSAYDVMALAKTKGAEVRAAEDWDVYTKALRKYQKKMGTIKNVVDLAQLFESYINPIKAVEGESLAGKVIGKTAASGLGASVLGGLLKGVFSVGKAPKFKATGGTDPYNVKAFDPYVRKAEGISEDIKSQIGDRLQDLFVTPGMYSMKGLDPKKVLEDLFSFDLSSFFNIKGRK